jgi:hypothetical protein
VTTWRRGWLARHRRYAAIGTGTCVAATVSGVLIFMPHQAGRSPHVLAADCGLVTCTATLPPSASARATASPLSTRPAAKPQDTISPAPSTTSPAPSTTSPEPSTTAVTVTYSVVQRWDDGFQGQFTIVNHGDVGLTRWQIRAAFPGDLVETAWGAGWQISGGTLVLTAPPYQATIPPGASQSANFTAQGNTTSPMNCTIDGTVCG